MSALPEYDPTDTQALLKVVRAHDGMEAATRSYLTEREELLTMLAHKHNPFIYAAQSVLYEAMGNAALNGFTPAEMAHAMDCDEH